MKYAQQNRQAGFTLVEMMIASTLLVTVFSSVVMAVRSSTRSFEMSAAQSAIDTKISRTMDRILREVSGAIRDSLDPAPTTALGAASLTFSTGTDYTANAVTWGDTTRIGYELAPGERNNGVDDNSDGLIDEAIVVRTINPGEANEQRIVLARGVSDYFDGELANRADDNGNGLIDERGLSFHLEDSFLEVRVSMQRIGPNGELIVRSLESTISLRN
ncbi:MAG: prepilin-type N-terminal cleavage/methylation domain-containing protein [bacterium]|nr:prepilin-type N-terminal cleavage/methylation domain-containing protein [bacterium]